MPISSKVSWCIPAALMSDSARPNRSTKKDRARKSILHLHCKDVSRQGISIQIPHLGVGQQSNTQHLVFQYPLHIWFLQAKAVVSSITRPIVALQPSDFDDNLWRLSMYSMTNKAFSDVSREVCMHEYRPESGLFGALFVEEIGRHVPSWWGNFAVMLG